MRTLFAFCTALVAMIGSAVAWRDPETGEGMPEPDYLKPVPRPEVVPNVARVISFAEAKRLRKQRARIAVRKRI